MILAAAFAVGFGVGPAQAIRMDLRSAKQGCANLVTQAHPALTEKKRDEEIRKCKVDPGAYGKAAGF